MIDFVRLNNRVVSAKSLSINIGGVPYGGILAAKYSEKIDKEHVYDQGLIPLGMTEGKYMPEDASITMLKDVFTTKLQPQLGILSVANLAPGAWGCPLPFPVIFSWVEPGVAPTIDVLSGCEIIGAEDDYAEGINAAVIVIGIKPMSLSRNGLTLYNRLRSLL